MKRLFVILILFSFLFTFSGCASAPKVNSNDPFSERLDSLYQQRKKTNTVLTFSVIGIGTSFIGGSLVATMHGLGNLNQHDYDVGNWIFYSLGTASTLCGVISFVKWDKSMNDYLETLRLQTQYYNIVE
jgi:hypothetical protein